MCESPTILKQDDVRLKDTNNGYGRQSTDISSENESSQESNSMGAKQTNNQESNTSKTNSIASFLKPCLLLIFSSYVVLEFALWLPFVIPGVSLAAIQTYIPAWYKYDDTLTKFDNTPWTYNTDFILTVVMFVLAIQCWTASAPHECPDKVAKNANSLKLRMYSAALLICYGVSTLAGGWAHKHFTSVDMLNTTRFWMFWVVCVGNVSFASCYMGLIGREVQKVFGVRDVVPLGPWWFWPAYGSYMTVACALGYISFKRPACDIFIAGITQFLPTFYCMAALGVRKWPSKRSNESPIGLVKVSYRIMYYVGFIGNAPLLPMYPMLVQYSGMSLAGVNTLLHSWLMVMWGLQGISLLHLCRAMSTYKPKASKD